MTNKKSPKIEALVVNAIRRLQDVQGSTPCEISNYISQEYDVQGRDIKKQVQLALRRGLSYGILQRTKGGCYVCNRDFLSKPMENVDLVQERCKRRRRRRRRSKCRARSRRSRRRRRSGRCKLRSRRRSRRSRAGRCKRRSRRRSRRRRRGKKCDGRPTTELNIAPAGEEPKRNESPERESRDASPRSRGSSISGSSNDRNLDENLSDPPEETMPSSFNSYIN